MIPLLAAAAHAGQIVCAAPRGLWPPPGSTLPTNVVLGWEIDDPWASVGPAPARDDLALEAGGQRIALTVAARAGGSPVSRDPSWLTLVPAAELPPDTTVQWLGPWEGPDPRPTWRTGPGPDREPPRLSGAPYVASRARSDETLVNTNSSLDGLRYHEDRVWLLPDVDETGPWLARVGALDTGYPAVPAGGLVAIGVDECSSRFAPPTGTEAYRVWFVDAAGNASEPVDVPPGVPPPEEAAATARRLAADPGFGATTPGLLEVCWTPTSNLVKLGLPTGVRELPANLGCWTGDAAGPVPVEVAGVSLTAAPPDELDVGPWLGEPDAEGFLQAVEAPDGALWVSGEGSWRDDVFLGRAVGGLWFAPDGGRFTSRDCELAFTPAGASTPAWTRAGPCGGRGRVVDADGVLWSGTTDGLVGIDARGATRDLPGVRLRGPVLGPDGALYGQPVDRGSEGVLRVVPATGEVTSWPGEVDGPLVAAGDGVYATVRGQGIARLGPDGPQVVGPELGGRLAGDRRGTLWWTDGEQVAPLGGEPLVASAVGCLGPISGLEEGAGRVWARCGARLVAVDPNGPTGATWQRPGRFGWSKPLLTEPDGSTWWGTDAGAARVRDGLPSTLDLGRRVSALVRVGEVGWALQLDGGLVRFVESADGSFEVTGVLPSSWRQGLALQAREGEVWVAGNGGVAWFGLDGEPRGRVGGSFRDLVVDEGGAWALAEDRIERIHAVPPDGAATPAPIPLPEGLRVSQLDRDGAGRLWVSGLDLAFWDGARWGTPLPQEAGPFDVVVEGDGSVGIRGRDTWRVGRDATEVTAAPDVVPDRGAIATGAGAAVFAYRGLPLRVVDGRLDEALYRVWTGPVGGSVVAAEDRTWTFGAGAAAARDARTGAWQWWSGVGEQGRDRVDELAPPTAAVEGGSAWFVRPRDWLLRLDPGGQRTRLDTPGAPLAVAHDRGALWLLAEETGGARALFTLEDRADGADGWRRLGDAAPGVRTLVVGRSGVWGVALDPAGPSEPARPSAVLLAPRRSEPRVVAAPIAASSVPDLVEAGDGSLWFAGIGVGRVEPGGRVTRYEHVGSYSLARGARVAVDPTGDRVWIAGGGAVGRIDRGKVVPVAVGLATITGLAVRDGVAWVSTVDGLVRLGADGAVDRLDPAVFARPGVPLSAGPTVAAPDRVAWWRDGTWVGPGHDGSVLTVDGDWALDAMGSIHHADGRQWRSPVARPAALVALPDGACVGGVGVACWSGDAVEQAVVLPPLPRGEVTALAVLDGVTWVGTDAGDVCRPTSRSWRCEKLGAAVRALVPGDGAVIAGHAEGVSWVDERRATTVRGPDVRSLAVQGEVVWAGTSRGLLRVSRSGWAAVSEGGESATPGATGPVLGLLADPAGLLLIRDGRVVRIAPGEGSCCDGPRAGCAVGGFGSPGGSWLVALAWCARRSTGSRTRSRTLAGR